MNATRSIAMVDHAANHFCCYCGMSTVLVQHICMYKVIGKTIMEFLFSSHEHVILHSSMLLLKNAHRIVFHWLCVQVRICWTNTVDIHTTVTAKVIG